MGKTEVRQYIHAEKGNTHSVDEQVAIAHAMWDLGIGPTVEDGPKRKTLEDVLGLDLDYQPRTSLRHLEEIGIVDEYTKPGPDTYVIAEWHPDVFIMGDVEGAAREGINALIDHIHDEDLPPTDESPAVADGAGQTLRHVVAEAFDTEPDALEGELRAGDPVEKLNPAVDAIEESDDFETRDDYGRIRFINAPNRYRLTNFAIDLYQE